MRGKKGNQAAIVTVSIVLIAAVLLMGAAGFTMSDIFGGDETASVAGTSIGGTVLDGSCVIPSDGDTTLTVTVYNQLNETGSESYDNTAYLYFDDGSSFGSLTDTTAGTKTVNPCKQLTFRMVSSDGAGGNSARILGLRAGPGAEIIEDGRGVRFVPGDGNYNLEINSKQHATLEARAFDNNNNAFMYNTNDGSNTNYDGDGIGDWQSTTDNVTATAIGSGGELDLTLDIRSTGADTDFSDLGIYVLIDAGTSVWDEPIVRFEGAKLSDVKGSLDVGEARAWSGYEYVYFVDSSVLDDGVEVDFVISALAGVDPASGDDVQIDFASKGASKQVAGNDVRYSGTQDDSSNSVIFAVMDFGVNIS